MKDEVISIAIEMLEGEVAGILFEDLVNGPGKLGPNAGGFRTIHLCMLFVGLDDKFFAGRRHGDKEGRKDRPTVDAVTELRCAKKGRREAGARKTEGGKEKTTRGACVGGQGCSFRAQLACGM